MIRLDIGCSFHKLPGYIGIDIESGPDVDVVADMHNMPFATSSVDEIHTRHTLEHVADLMLCISELYRTCRPGGKITVIVPHYSNDAYWADPTHLRPFSVRSFQYYDLEYVRQAGFPVYLPDVHLKTRRVRLIYWPERVYISKSPLKRWLLRMMNGLISGLANLNPFLCERLWCYWVGGFYEVIFELEPVKRIVDMRDWELNHQTSHLTGET